MTVAWAGQNTTRSTPARRAVSHRVVPGGDFFAATAPACGRATGAGQSARGPAPTSSTGRAFLSGVARALGRWTTRTPDVDWSPLRRALDALARGSS